MQFKISAHGSLLIINKLNVFGWFNRKTNDVENVKRLLMANDKGGISTKPIKLNQVARRLGIDVSPSVAMQKTIQRIRLVLKRT